MTDAVALLALSQLICLGGLGYLYLRLQEFRRLLARTNRALAGPAPAHPAARAAARAYAQTQPAARSRAELAALAAQLRDGKADIAALARRLNRSEEEIRLLLRTRGVTS